MSRRRSSNPTKAISVTIPELLLRNIDRTLSYEQSRSLWITNACREYLNKTDSTPFDVRNLTYESLLKWIINHDDVDEVLKKLLLQILSE
jgi:metal-responsive CopG/Arc/MetJ family transcriptional regulator